jgi:mRNA interferase RelE/StbE
MKRREYKVYIDESARDALAKLPKKIQRLIVRKIDALSMNPRPKGAKQLQGHDRVYRIRSGDYRIIYRVDDKKITVFVISIGDRKDIYRKLIFRDV